jgi:hypothetical protein
VRGRRASLGNGPRSDPSTPRRRRSEGSELGAISTQPDISSIAIWNVTDHRAHSFCPRADGGHAHLRQRARRARCRRAVHVGIDARLSGFVSLRSGGPRGDPRSRSRHRPCRSPGRLR